MKSKSRVSVWQMLLAAGLATAVHAFNAQADLPPPVGPESVESDQTVTPEGDYSLAHLTLQYEGDAPAQRVPLVLGLRQGQGVTAWLGDGERHYPREVAVTRQGDALKGQIQFGFAEGPISRIYVLDVNVREGAITGAFTGTHQGQPVKGTVNGVWLTAQQARQRYSPAKGADWPGYYGAGWNLSVPKTQTPLLDDPSQAQPVWRSEQVIGAAWGRGPDWRYAGTAVERNVNTGASTPVVADGKVYLYYYVPSGEISERNREILSRKAPATLERMKEAHNWAPTTEFGRMMSRMALERADDVVLCMDAATGQTLWRTTFAGRAPNIQTHKWRGINPTPLVVGDTIFVINYARALYALDTRTGKPIWEYKDQASDTGRADAASPAYADGVVAMGGAAGIDAGTGKVLWTGRPGPAVVWKHDGKERFIIIRGGAGSRSATVSCVDPRTGQELWSQAAQIDGEASYQQLLVGDLLIGMSRTPKGEKHPPFWGEETRHHPEHIAAFRLSPEGMTQAWRIVGPNNNQWYGMAANDTHLYVDGKSEVWCIELDSGKVLAKAAEPEVQGFCHISFLVGDRLFINPSFNNEQSFIIYDADPKNFRRISPVPDWHPPHPRDSAYANHPLGSPVVDGMLYCRGYGGIFCYDLRARTTNRDE